MRQDHSILYNQKLKTLSNAPCNQYLYSIFLFEFVILLLLAMELVRGEWCCVTALVAALVLLGTLQVNMRMREWKFLCFQRAGWYTYKT